MMPGFLRKFLNFVALGLLLLPLKNGSKLQKPTTNHNGVHSVQAQGEEDEDILGATNDAVSLEIPNPAKQRFMEGIVVDGQRNKLLNLQLSETTKPVLSEILKEFQPEFSSNEASSYLEQYQMLVGEDVDHYLEVVRKGSWGTTVMAVDEQDRVHFQIISLRQFLLDPNYVESRPGAINQLIQEEFFQAHQYDLIAANLYNRGYLAVAGIHNPEALSAAVSKGNLRAFLELFPQQQYLFATGYGRNSYNYYIGQKLFSGPPNSSEVVNAAYLELANFIEQDLGIKTTPRSFLNPETVIKINDKFREKYLPHYVSRGFLDEQVQIWNLVGLYRNNSTNAENTLDLKAVLTLP